ncbi:ATP-grasp fold amidoligase family protein [Flagellimonas marinaquae]
MMFYKLLVFILGESSFLRWKYYYRTGRRLNLRKPERFSEKLQWLKLNHRLPEMTQMADKILAKQYVSERIGEPHVIKLLKVFELPQELQWDDMPPPPFVLKTNHDSGGVRVIRDKSDFNVQELQRFFEQKMHSFYHVNLEWEYKNIQPAIFAEEHLQGANRANLLQDFKVHCFNGKPRFIQTISDRESGAKENWFDTEWNALDMCYFSTNKAKVKQPATLGEMLVLSEKLAGKFPYIRIDWYNCQGRVYFGEFTFRPYGGFMNWNKEEVDFELGRLIKLPN